MTVRIILPLALVLVVGAGCTASVAPETPQVPTVTALTATVSPLATPTLPSESDTEPATETPASTPQPVETSALEPTPGSASQGEETMTPQGESPSETLPQVIFAKEDLAQRLNLPLELIEVLEVQFKTWPDGSLGCPKPGMMYPQVLQDGLLIRLQAEGKVYNYHSGGMSDPFLCDQSDIHQKATPPMDIELRTQPPPSLDE